MCNGCVPQGDYEKESMREELSRLSQNHLGATTERFIEFARGEGEHRHLLKENDMLKRANEDLIYRLRNAEGQVVKLEQDAKRDYATITSLRNSWHSVSENYRKYRDKQKKAAVK